jgi:hypothetical protein
MSGSESRPESDAAPHPYGLGVFAPPIADDVDWDEALAAGPGALWAIPEPVTITWTSDLHADLVARIEAAGAAWATILGILGLPDDGTFDRHIAPLMHRAVIALIAGAADEAEYFDA